MSPDSVVLSGRGLCDGPIIRTEEPYKVCCVECDSEASTVRRFWPTGGGGGGGGGEKKKRRERGGGGGGGGGGAAWI